MSKISAIRYHDICAGHRVVGHESKCKNLHGHNYRFWFYVESYHLDKLGRVIDFSVIKSVLCDWLELNWDHKMILWEEDPIYVSFTKADLEGVVIVPFNPTAENMAMYFVDKIAPNLLKKTGVRLRKLRIEETRKCSVEYEKDE